jgi:hypothetical protein
MARAVAGEYSALIDEARAARGLPSPERGRALARLRRALRLIRARDYFSPPEAARAERAVEGLAAAVEIAA